MIKVLHIWNAAGVGGYLSDYMRRYYKIKSDVLMRLKYDQYHLANKYVKSFTCGYKEFVIRCWLRGMFYDIIHIHCEDKILKFFREIMPYKNKKMILHYHGKNIRNRWSEKEKLWRQADKIIVATPDLLEGAPDIAEYLPNVIDEKLCDLFKLNRKFNNSAFHTTQEATGKAFEYAHKYRLRLSIHHAELDPLSHSDYLNRLSRYEYYIDVKMRDGRILEAMSLTGLEALYMDVKVIRWDGKKLNTFPPEHLSVSVCEKLKNIYEDLMK